MHVSWQDASVPHVRLQVVAPEQSTVQPPEGHSTVQVLLPWQVTLVPLPADSVHVLLPSQPRLEPVPAARVHVLPPVHVEAQFEPQVPEQLDLPAQLVVQPVPQLTLQSFLAEQSNVTPLGGGGPPPSRPPSPPPPSEQVPPEAHVHVEPLQEQEPVHDKELPAGAPEHAGTSSAMRADRAIALSMIR